MTKRTAVSNSVTFKSRADADAVAADVSKRWDVSVPLRELNGVWAIDLPMSPQYSLTAKQLDMTIEFAGKGLDPDAQYRTKPVGDDKTKAKAKVSASPEDRYLDDSARSSEDGWYYDDDDPEESDDDSDAALEDEND